MTTIDPTTLKPGDRIRYSREAVVNSVSGRAIRLEVKTKSGSTGNFTIENDYIPTTFELLERPLPEEPPVGSVVVFHYAHGPEAWKRWGGHLGWLHAGTSTPLRRDGSDRQGLTWEQLLAEPTRSVERTVITP